MLVHGNYYGTHKSFLENISQRGKICILELDIKGAEKIHSQYPNANYLFFNVKEFDTLKKRIIGRGSDAEDMIEKRLETAKFELENYKKMGFFIEIFNEDLEICYQEVIGYLQKWYPNVKFN